MDYFPTTAHIQIAVCNIITTGASLDMSQQYTYLEN